MTPGTLKLIAGGVIVALVLGLSIMLINYGEKLGKCKAENVRLEGEVKEAIAWKEDALKKMTAKDEAIGRWAITADSFEMRYMALAAEPPQIITRWREIATEVPIAVPLGDCDRAATNAWDVLMQAGVTGGTTWDDSSYSPPSLQDVLDAVQLERNTQPPSLNLYLSPSPYRQWNESVGTYQLSNSQIYSWNR